MIDPMIDIVRAFSIATLMLACLAASVDAQTEVNRLLPAAPGGSVEISCKSGSVTVIGWDRDEIEIRGTLASSVAELKVEQRGKRTEIEVDVDHHGRHKSHADLEIKVPHQSSIELETISAELTVTGVAGQLDIETLSGPTHIEGSPRLVKLESVSGSVDVRGAVTELDVETVSGDVNLKGSFPRLELSAVSGKVVIETADAIHRADLEAVSGSITVSGDLTPGGSIKVSMHSGAVTLTLPSTVSAQFDVTTYSGDIENAFGPEARKVDRYTPAKELRFSNGSGSGRVEIDSFSGDVVLRRR